MVKKLTYYRNIRIFVAKDNSGYILFIHIRVERMEKYKYFEKFNSVSNFNI